ncbi:glycosyltransferase family 39 protein [Rhizobium sp. NRK18]|uniref:glycosyltransferase family 39 protein n=1 Tax=Rhizobium sp. NRK18 TaxID=2964667 RepID=UPI0021C28E28|nr:glycosyltransferase family 39 protein [Rhizobium sp. NRK18]MCQ2004837.1 glycosyltransferase family 39 protein [Rhizobium sp. NRK18]
MTARPAPPPAARAFALLFLYFVLSAIIRLSLPHSLRLDEAEQIYMSQWLSWGYGAQPPLYNWLQQAVFAITGPSIVGIVILKNALLFACFIFYWLAASTVIRDPALRLATIAGLVTLPQVSLVAQQDLTHTIVLLAVTAAFLYAFFRTLTAPSLASYLLAGLTVGLGVLSKYNFALLPVVAILALLPDPALRKRVFDWRLVAALLLAGLIVLPHALWFLDHAGLATQGTLGKMQGSATGGHMLRFFKGIGALIMGILAFSALTLVVFAAIFKKPFLDSLKSGNAITRVIERMFVLTAVALVLIVLVTGTTKMNERWLDPFLLVLPLYLAAKMEAAGMDIAAGLKRLSTTAAVILIGVAAFTIIEVTVLPVAGLYKRINIPYGPFLQSLKMESAEKPAMIVTQSWLEAGNLRQAFPSVPVLAGSGDELQPATTIDSRHPLLLVWTDNKHTGEIPGGILNSAKTLAGAEASDIEPRSMTLPYHFGWDGETYTFGYAWLPSPGTDGTAKP